MTSLEGALLDGRFEVRALLATGGMSLVYRAHDRGSASDVAIKVPSSAAPAVVARLEGELRASRRLGGPHVCRLVAHGTLPSGLPYAAFELLEGETLAARLAREGALPLPDVDAIATHVLVALVEAHRAGVVHRDVSASNVVLTAAGAKLIDFGLSKTGAADGTTTERGTVLGSLAYAAPEQLGGDERVDHRADQYGLASVVVHALTGRPPFGDEPRDRLLTLKRSHDAPTLDEITGHAWPAPLRDVVARMLARRSARRFPSTEVAAAAWRKACDLALGHVPEIRPVARSLDPTATLRGPVE